MWITGFIPNWLGLAESSRVKCMAGPKSKLIILCYWIPIGRPVQTYFLTMLSLNVWLSTLHETVKVQLQWVKLIPNQTRVHHILVKQKLPGASLGYKWRKNRLGYYYGSSVEYGIKIWSFKVVDYDQLY